MSKKQLIASVALSWLVLGGLKAQEADSTVTVPTPPGYAIPGHLLDSSLIALEEEDAALPVEDEELEVVTTALTDPDIYELQFDTTMAIALEEVGREDLYVPKVTEDLLMDRLACLQRDVPLTYHERVKGFIDFYAVRRRDFTLRVMQRKNLYFPIFERVLKEHNMPDELKYLSIIESALIPTARSRVGAVGLWQFMPATGKMFDLKQDNYIDFRQDPEKATRAACLYLKQLYNIFGDWELAIASYNCGPGNVRKAIRRSGAYHFWDIYHNLPKETRSYLPQLVAMIYVMNHAEEHHLIQDQPDYPTPANRVYVDGPLDLVVLADELRVCVEDLMLMNPELKRAAVPSGQYSYGLMIPSARYDEFTRRRSEIVEKASKDVSFQVVNSPWKGFDTKTTSNKYYHIVRKGEVLGSIAERYDVPVSQLQEWNGLGNARIYPGQKLVLFAASGKSVPKTAIAANSRSGGATFYTVKRGDVLGSIANRYGVSVANLRAWNRIKGTNLQIGQKLRVKAPEERAVETATAEKQPEEKEVIARPVAKTTTTKYHTVKSGEVLGSIADRYGITVSQLKVWNNLRGNTIRVGQKLVVAKAGMSQVTPVTPSSNVAAKEPAKSVPAQQGSTYTVRSGDSLWSIANQFGLTVADLKKINNMTSSSLQIGQTLKVKKAS